MHVDDPIKIWLGDDLAPEMLSTPLPDEVAGYIVERLKQEADRHWSIDPNCSLKYADRIVAIGRARRNKSEIALGLMARGDALKYLGDLQVAWDMLEQAGDMYLSADNEVGWARTRIGRLSLGPDLNLVKETLADVERARAIFQKWNESEKLVRLEINTAYIYTLLGEQQQALQLFQSALSLAEKLGVAGEPHLGMLYMNIGYVYESLGDFHQALPYYEKARVRYLERKEARNLINIEKNIACISLAQGHYRSALTRLNNLLADRAEQFPRDDTEVRHSLAECFLELNRFAEARDVIQQVLKAYRSFNDSYNTARALLHLATAEVELGNLAAARSALDEASFVFTSLDSLTWGMISRLWHGQVAFRQGDYELAGREAHVAAECFQEQGQQVNYASASLLMGQVAFARNDFVSASSYGQHALQIAQRHNIPSLRYAAHLLLGRIARSNSFFVRALRNFRAAAATVERVQRGLTITMRSGFLENKGEAWRELIDLYLRQDQTDRAFNALEQAKSQVLFNYLANREQFHWSREKPESQSLIDELERLRAEHQVFYHMAFNPPREQEKPGTIPPTVARAEAAAREKRIRAITERLYLLSHSERASTLSFDSLFPTIQACLDEQTLLVEFYDDGERLWAFVLDSHSHEVHPLPVNVETLSKLLTQLKTNIAAGLRVEPGTQAARQLTLLGQRILQRLYTVLLEPLGVQTRGRERLIIVPYGVLHYLPFHVLYDGAAYLIENCEVVILPAASLLTRTSPRRSPGALILSHSWNGRLPHTLAEAQIVRGLFDGVLYSEESATRAVLQTKPSQILHVATHGQYRLDQPELSFLELADGQLYADDLLQQDMSYELVTLSGCETGQANVAADEELIGIGRGLLYAGAGALILSMWQVADTATTLTMMERLYTALHAGSSKAAALREAQLFVLQQDRGLHPALWGAFQLVGDAKPLSNVDEYRERS